MGKQAKACSIDGCEKPRYGRGWCAMHYSRWKRRGDPLVGGKAPRPVTCSIDGCDRPHYGLGWCKPHWKRWYDHGDPLVAKQPRFPTLREYLWYYSTPHIEGECWEWSGPMGAGGYGVSLWGGARQVAHRAMWEQFNGPIPDGLLACHHCDNRRCCNPRHLFLGTQRDNVDDMLAKGRSPRGEDRHCAKLTEENVRQLRREYQEGALFSELGQKYGVATEVARRAVRGISWKHVPGAVSAR